MIKLKSPAKVNLGLTVTGLREDGYHLLNSLFWPINIVDEITVQSASTLSVITQNKYGNRQGLPQQSDNLVWHALHYATRGTPPSWKIEITKCIPVGGGLGGGSSNAATVLKYLSKTTNIEISPKTISEIGADLPFFLYSRPSIVTGIGEEISILDVEPSIIKDLAFLLITPPFQSHTKEVFKAYRMQEKPISILPVFEQGKTITWESLLQFLKNSRNSLEDTIVKGNPFISNVLKEMRNTTCIYAGISGTGSSCIAVFKNQADCERTSKDLKPFCRTNDCRCLIAKTFTEG